jgi:hypothetical protein
MFDLETPPTAPAAGPCLPASRRLRRAPVAPTSRAALLREARQPVTDAFDRLGGILAEALASAAAADRGRLLTLATVLDGLARELGSRFEVVDEAVLPFVEAGLAVPMPDLLEALERQAATIHGQLRRLRGLMGDYRLSPEKVHLAELWATVRCLERDLECLLAAERTLQGHLAG